MQGAAQNGGRYGLLTYNTANIGDEIQSIAAQQFLPAIDMRIDRDRLNRLPAGADGPYKIILNGWHSHAPERWPPGPFLDPLLTSIHITQEVLRSNEGGIRPAEIMLRGEGLDYMRDHGPVGARDLWTRDLLQSHGVDAFFSGCMTLTLGDGQARPRGDYICAVDLPPALLWRLRETTKSRLAVRAHTRVSPKAFGERAFLARRLLSLYAQAKCVVTSRLHCALPSLALGTPVLFIMTAKDSYRFSGLTDFLHTCSPQAFFDGKFDFDLETPPPNRDAYRPYRAALIATANRFIGNTAADAALHPFIPEPLSEALLEDEPINAVPRLGEIDNDVFRRVFPVGRDYTNQGRPDFLRDMARVYEKSGNLVEAERLLRLALRDRPAATGIRDRLEAIEKSKTLEAGLRLVEPGATTHQPSPIAGAVRDRRRTYLTRRRLESLIAQASGVKSREVPGNFVECGIGLGGSGICLASQLDGARQYWGFDVFGMIPPPSAADGDIAKERYDTISSGRSTGIGGDPYYGYVDDLYRKVADGFAEFGLRVDGATVNLVPGLFENTLPQHVNFPVALAHIDCDWYEPVKYCLNLLRDRVPKYGVIVVDDYLDWPGCRAAVDEFLAENGNMLLDLTRSHAVLLKT